MLFRSGESPLSVSGAYAAFGNGGYYNEPYSYTKVILRDTGKEHTNKKTTRRAMSEETAYIVYNMLESVASQGYTNYFQNNVIRKMFGVKTGTSNFSKETKQANGLPDSAINDLWMAGVSDEYTMTVWYGYDKIYKDAFSHFGNRGNVELFSQIAKDVYTRNSVIAKPDGVISVTVEAETKPAQLPSAYTPDNLKVTELWKKGTEPTTVSNRFQVLSNPASVSGSCSGGVAKINWSAIKTPEVLSSEYISKYFSSLFKDAGYLNSYVNARLGYNANVLGALGYDIYEKHANGTLVKVATTTDNKIQIPLTSNEGTGEYIVKTAFANFKSTQSSGVSTKFNVSTCGSPEIKFGLSGDTNIIIKVGA